ncbi:hypothetical protein M8J75_013825 [Diaphorina citri]|nr:hypothetical protein M8J75_013825 [Diaphorina citri]
MSYMEDRYVTVSYTEAITTTTEFISEFYYDEEANALRDKFKREKNLLIVKSMSYMEDRYVPVSYTEAITTTTEFISEFYYDEEAHALRDKFKREKNLTDSQINELYGG